MSERERFEKKARKHALPLEMISSPNAGDMAGEYLQPLTYWAWVMWQASAREQAENKQQLTDALERTLANFKLILAQKPVRDASETIAEAERALRESFSREAGTQEKK